MIYFRQLISNSAYKIMKICDTEDDCETHEGLHRQRMIPSFTHTAVREPGDE
jgi:hypothetical protein